MANYINKERRQIDFDPFDLRIIAVPEVVAVQFKPRSEHTLLIRIADVGATYQPLKHESLFEAILPVHFNDINEEDDYWGLSDKEQAEMKLFNEVHRDLIYDFVDEHPDFTQIVVHCHAGVSRSSAVAMAIAEHLGDTDTYEKLQVIKRYLPNPRVLAIMRGEAYL
ncbi:TPA: tyrosine phosphatase family protein [Listeria monocytogenes]|uniref:Tyrosine phosphatase family protein n=3 Tax=Listeria monocytogenes TaxID=1639 RepID=A0A5D5WCA6_LISMN|nr:tyrosine phosphatase family protein [Listeria monocytogenes]EAD3235142.1 hypothetical protein [Listeria monocytogenes CFSAN002202]EAE3729286.1 hypothetical protein [Listeria monocytogenes serotype 1/2a]EAG6255776.1 hypothetical protein [Listeria monocytogenes CFSAN003807]EAG6289154.1 hypothetical protein [Listeria monocytogenes CFSAN003825]EAG6316408.1 hypothetical protein [Listeria monocytogenes CFSAN003824]EAG6340150.1 hypothetical protein [Listeria monocytogenes CFSAN003811]EAG9423197.